jgi:translocation and assembly module TamB
VSDAPSASSTPAHPARRRWWKYLLILFGLSLIFLGAFSWYMTTESFQAYVRRRIVSALEDATGARVELGAYHTIPFRLQVEIRDFTLHGLEGPEQTPLAHVDSVTARIKVISLLETSFGFHSIVLEHPVVHLIVYPDGSTNLPRPKLQRAPSEKTTIEQLFSFSINQLEVHRGEFQWNNEKVPFEFKASDVASVMVYSFLRGRYEGDLALGRVETRYEDFRPFAWNTTAHFTLGKDDVEVTSLRWSSANSHFEASGHVTDFVHPKIDAAYAGSVDLGEAAEITHQPQLKRGVLELNGKGNWTSLDKFAADGKAALKNFDWRDQRLNLRDANLNTDFSINERELKLAKMQGRLLGGTVTGDADVSNWLPPQTVSATLARNARDKGKKQEEQKGVIRLRLKDISAEAVAVALTTREYPLDKLNLAGATEGSIESRWTGSPVRAEITFALNLTPPAKLQAREIPVTAIARGTYRAASDELELAQLDLYTRFSQVHASGRLAATSTLQVSANTTDLAEIQPLVTAFHGPERLPISLHGNAHFTGNASGKLSSVRVNGHLQINDFDSLIPATSRTPEQDVHWDSLAADVQVSPHNLAVRHATAVHGDTMARFEASASLTRGEFSPGDTFTANLELQKADIAELRALAGYDYPVTGRMDLGLQAGGTRAAPHADGHVHLADVVAYGQPIQEFDSDLRWNAGQASFNNIRLTYRDSLATGGAAYEPDSHNFRFNLTAKNFDLTHIPKLESTRIPIEGRLDFTAQGSGTLEAPAINAKIIVRDLTLDRERTGNLVLEAVSEGNSVRLTASSEFEHAKFSLDGTVIPRGDYVADLVLRFDHLDADSLMREYLNGRIEGHSAVTGEVEIRGPLRDPRNLNLVAKIDGFDANIDQVRIHNEGPIRFTIAQQTARLEQFHIVGEDTDFSAHGTASLFGTRDLDLAADGHLNLALIQTLNPDFTSSGTVDMAMTISGPAKDPVLQGSVNISHGSIAYVDLPSGLSDMNGTLTFNKHRLQIDSLTAHSGGGTVTLAGEATSYAGQINFDFAAKAQEVRLRYPPGVSSTANADLRFYGSRDSATLSGDVTITKLAITPGFDFAAYAASSRQSVIVPPATSPLYRIKLDVHVVTAPDLQMQTAIARLSGDADLRLRGTAAKPALLGRVEVLEGEISFNGAKYRLERGEVLFQSPVSIQPVLDLQATTRVRDYDITVSVNGDTSKPLSIKYRSDPPLPEADIIALLAVGQTREESAQLAQSSNSAFTETASNLILSEALNATVGNRVQRLFGVSRIKIDPQGLNTETNPTRGPQVTIEQQISNLLTLTFSQNVSQASQQIIQGEYYLRKNISIQGTRDQNGVVSFDVKIRQRKK